MGRAPCCDKEGLKKGPWTPEEDKILVDYIQSNGHGSWRSLPKLAGLLRCGKSCRLRWTNYLRPDIKRGPFTPEEQKSIIQLHGIVGNKWSTIAAQLPGRTDNEVKNYWNTHLKKRLVKMGIDPDTYTPAASGTAISRDTSSSPASCSSPASVAATRHMAQWESARLEAEARLSKESLLFSSSTPNTTSLTLPGEEEAGVTAQKKTDFFLRIWNSEVGRAFRNRERAGTAGSSSSLATSSTAVKTKDEEDEGMEQAGTTTATTTSEEEGYQMQMDFAALGVDDLLGFGSLFSNGQFCNFSLFDSGDPQLNDGDSSPLDDIDGFSKWEDHHHQHQQHQYQHVMEETTTKV